MNRLEYLLSRTTPDHKGCLNWNGAKKKDGRALIWQEGKCNNGARVIWSLIHSVVLASDICVCHHCDNPSCINIDHLFLGTLSDNTVDSVNKNRHKEARKTHCPRGHDYALFAYINKTSGQRQCRECGKIYKRNKRNSY